jgi:phage-related protein
VADGLEDVTQNFDADVTEYLAAVDEAAATAQEFAAANEEAKAATDGLRDSAAEATAALDGVRDSAAEAAGAQEAVGASAGQARDHLAEVAAAAGIYRDELGKLRDAQGRFVGESVLEDLALGHTRDEALEAAAAFKKLRDAKVESDVAGGGGGLLSGFFGGGGGAGGLGAIPLPALIAIVPAVEAALPEILGLVSGFAAAGAGAGAFALLAIPAIKQVTGALGDSKAQLDKLPEPVRQAVDGVKGLKDEFGKMSAAFQPEAFKVLNDVLQIANQVLPYVTPFAKTFADALDGLLQKVSQFTGSTGFKDWLNQFHSLEGPAITAIGDGLGKVAVSAGKLLTVMSSKDVVNAINIAFTILNGTIQLVTYMIKRLMDNWDGMSVAVRHSWYDIKQWTDDVTKVFDTVRHAAAEFGHDWAGYFDTARHTVASWGHDTASAFDTTRHAIATGAHDIAGAFDTVRHAIATAGHDIAGTFDTVRHDAASFAHDVASAWDTLRHAVATLGHDIASGFDTIRHTIASWANDVKTDIGRVVSWFTALPGQVMNVLASLPGRLVQYGRDIVQGLINGVRSMAGTLLSAIESLIPGPIRSVVSAALGIFSPSTVFHGYGVNIVQGLINGVASMQPHLRSAIGELAGGITGPGSALAAGAVGAAGGSTSVHVNIPVTAAGTAAGVFQSPQYQQALQAAVQEVTLRYGNLNPNNGLTPMWGR